MTQSIDLRLELLFFPVQKAQIALPPDRKDSREHETAGLR